MKKNKGFTLVELVVVMAIIAVLVALALFAINAARLQGRNTERRSNIQAFKVALESFYSGHTPKEYPNCGATAQSIYAIENGSVSCTPAAAPAVGDFIGAGFQDPNGQTGRSCYLRNSATSYTLRLNPETLTGGAAACSTLGTESYDQT